MSQGLFSIGGIASGLDTQAIIAQLMQLERIPVTRLQQQQADLRKVDDAWGQVNTRLSALRTAIDKIRTVDKFNGMATVTSSNPDAVGVEKSGVNGTGSLTFSVTQLASAHQISGPSFATADDLVAGGAGSFSVSVGGGENFTVEVDENTTLKGLASKLNAQASPVSASVVKVAEGDFRLVLTSRESGVANQITVDTDVTALDAANFTQRQAGRDAQLVVGEGVDALTITRSSNTISDLVDGATITLKQTTAGPVTVSAERDVDGAVAAVKAYNEAVNGVLDTIKKLSAYDAAAAKGGPLTGNSTARRMVDQLRRAVIGPDGAGHPLGFSLTKEGGVALDEAKLRAAFVNDYDGTVQALSSVTTTSTSTQVPDGVTSAHEHFVSATADTQPGTYSVVVNAPTQATLRIASYAGHQNGSTIRLTSGGVETDNIVLPVNATPAQARDAINAALDAKGITNLRARVEGADLVIEDDRLGPEGNFTLTAVQRWAYDAGEVVGEPLNGTIDGEAATVDGDTLVATSGPAAGLVVAAIQGGTFDITLDQAYRTEGSTTTSGTLLHGVHNALRLMEGSGGSIARARQSLTGQIKLYQDRIDSFDRRLEQREITLRRQFTALETAMGQLNSQGNWLASQLAGLQNNWNPNR